MFLSQYFWQHHIQVLFKTKYILFHKIFSWQQINKQLYFKNFAFEQQLGIK